MKKTFKLENLDCPNCASKMEREISKLEGVRAAQVTFLTQKLTLDADDARFDDILAEAEKRIRKVDAECVLVK